jgi:hypothetical protein
MAKKREILRIVFSIIITLLIIFCIKTYIFFHAKPNVAVNYVKLVNKLTKPPNYDPCDNAIFDYEKASSLFVDKAEITQSRNGVIPWPSWPGDMNDGQLKTFKEWFLENNKALAYFEKGSKKTYFWQEIPENKTKLWEIIFLPISDIRSLSIALCSQAKLDALEGLTEKAFDETVVCMDCGYQLTKSKRSLEQRVGQNMLRLSFVTILEILSNTRPTAKDLTKLQSQLEAKVDIDLTFDFEFAKMTVDDFIQRIFSDDGKGNGHLLVYETARLWKETYIIQPQRRTFGDFLDVLFSRGPKMPQRNSQTRPFLKRAVFGPDRKKTMEKFDEIYKELDEFQKLTPWQLHNKGIDPQKQSVDKLKSDWLITDIDGFFYYGVIELMKQSSSEQSALITTIAILRFKADKGNFPDNLDELLKAGYLKELPQDPYSNGSLTYKRAGDNFVLYSIGPNFKDDGGKAANNTKVPGWWEDKGDRVFWPVKTKEGNNK